MSARRQTAWYRAAKFVRRHRVAAGAAATLLVPIFASAALLYQVLVRNQERTRQAADLAQMASQASAAILNDMGHSQLDLARAEGLRLRDTLAQAGRDYPDDPVVSNALATAYQNLGQLAWFRVLAQPAGRGDGARLLPSRARHFRAAGPAEPFRRRLPASNPYPCGRERPADSAGRGFDASIESRRLLQDDEARVAAEPAANLSDVANLGSYYDMLSDRLGANIAWPARGEPAWYTAITRLRPGRMTDSIAMVLYERSLSGRGVGNPVFRR